MSNKALWAGRIMSGVAVLFMIFDGLVKVLKTDSAVQGTVALGFDASVLVPLGITVLVCVLLFVMPRTAFLGALLLTGYLGGAVAAQVRVHAPFYFLLMPVVVAVFLWAGLYVASPSLRRIFGNIRS